MPRGKEEQKHEMNIWFNAEIVKLSDYGSEDITILGNGRAFISAVSICVEFVLKSSQISTWHSSEKFVHCFSQDFYV